jgi:hypothetical protein
MKLFLRALFTLIAATLPAAPLWATGLREEPSQKALELVKTLPASRMGVDREGNLWVWNARRGVIDLISPAGALLRAAQAKDASAVDVDPEWGVVGIFALSQELRWTPWGQEERAQIRFKDPITDIRWIGPARVAVTPQKAPHRVEIWDLEARKLVRTFGKERPIVPVPGVNRLRGIRLHYDFGRERLYTFETYTGELQVFDRQGRRVWGGTVKDPSRRKTEKWLRDNDKKAKAQQDVQTPLLLFLSFTVDEEGNAWVVKAQDRERRTASLVRLTPRGSSVLKLKEEPCLSPDATLWGSRLIFYQDSSSPTCLSPRRLL